MHAALDSSNADRTLQEDELGNEFRGRKTGNVRPNAVDLLLHSDLLLPQRDRIFSLFLF